MTTTTDTAAQPVFSEGVVFDGAAILRDGVMMTVGEILEALTSGAEAEARVKELEAQCVPVAWFTDDRETDKSATTYSIEVAGRWGGKGWMVGQLYEIPSQPKPAVYKKAVYKNFFVRLFCSHEFALYRTIHGDEANYARSEWRCTKCGKHTYSQYLDKM